jgi:archaellum component FlaG (FlaF/FlaG flagellin family)
MGILNITQQLEETMEKEKDQTSEGLNQIFEIINAKGDEGELKQIVEKNQGEQQTETNA